MTVGGANRICEWCSAPLNAKQVVACSTPCRMKRWHWLNGLPIGKQGVPEPPDGSVLLLGAAGASSALRASRAVRTGSGGLQVSVGRMLEVLQGEPWVLPERQARKAIARALSDKQRERFLASEPVRVLPGQLNLEDAA